MLVSMALVAESIGADHLRQPGPPCWDRQVRAQSVRHFAEQVWALDRWERGAPPERTIHAFRHKLRCSAGPGHRKAAKHAWRKAKRAFYQHRSAMLWLEEFKPYIYPDGTRWAAPYPIAWCESGGDYYVGPSGAYGEVPPFPQWQPPKVQDEIAHQLMQEGKEYSAWVEWEGGCPYR